MSEADPQQRVNLSQNWTDQHTRLMQYAKKDWQAASAQGQPAWYMPKFGDWNGSLFDLEGMSKAFDRSDHEQDFEQIVKDPTDPGCIGDLMATQLQGDFLATLERAFRERHKTWPRMMVHANARRYGHQHDLGVLQTGMKDYLTWILRMTGSDDPGSGANA